MTRASHIKSSMNNNDFVFIIRKTDILRSKYPFRTSAAGPNSGLMIVINAMTNDYHSTFFSGYGVRVMLTLRHFLQKSRE